MTKIGTILKKIREDSDFESSKNYVEDGLLDSFDIMELVEELEEGFDIEIKGSDIIPENFVNEEAISKLIKTRLEEV